LIKQDSIVDTNGAGDAFVGGERANTCLKLTVYQSEYMLVLSVFNGEAWW
jgi:hypothetical protein